MLSVVIRNIYGDIKELSDIDFQREVWLGKHPIHISSFSEVMNRLFSDNNFDDFVDRTIIEIGGSKIFASELLALRILLDGYLEKETDEQILSDPEWAKVSVQAKKVIDLWNIDSGNWVIQRNSH